MTLKKIEAQTSKRYSPSVDNDRLTESGISGYLASHLPYRIELYDSVSSTMTLVHDRRNENEGLVIAAANQTGGIGRMGRSFYSPKDTGIYFSVLLKPNLQGGDITIITTMAAVAVCQAIENLSNRKPKIKWVNDIFIDNKKVCGILTQASFSLENQKAEFAILGIGLNVYAPAEDFPVELRQIAGEIFDVRQGGIKNRLLAEVLTRFWLLYTETKHSVIVEMYKAYSFVIGKQVTIISGNTTTTATVLDINNNCNLIVRYDDGKEDILSSGEISIRL